MQQGNPAPAGASVHSVTVRSATSCIAETGVGFALIVSLPGCVPGLPEANRRAPSPSSVTASMTTASPTTIAPAPYVSGPPSTGGRLTGLGALRSTRQARHRADTRLRPGEAVGVVVKRLWRFPRLEPASQVIVERIQRMVAEEHPGHPARRPCRPRGHLLPGLRHHARQLLVYLTLHRAGADLPDIMEAFWPTATMRRASERLSTEVSDLRGRVRQATADPKAQAVINTGGRYHLNPDLLDIDVWRFADALRRAAASTEPAAKTQALCEAIDAHTGTLADGYDYDWIEPPREQMRRHAITARLHLAELLASRDAHAAADLTRAAAALDPYNEDLARKAMTALARIGDADGIRVQLHQLRVALDEIDEEPSAETIALAAQLQRDLHHRTPPGDDPNVQQP